MCRRLSRFTAAVGAGGVAQASFVDVVLSSKIAKMGDRCLTHAG
jgi:hypothetical protein